MRRAISAALTPCDLYDCSCSAIQDASTFWACESLRCPLIEQSLSLSSRLHRLTGLPVLQWRHMSPWSVEWGTPARRSISA